MAAGVAFAVPGPIEALEFGAQGQGFAGEGLSLAEVRPPFFDEEEEEVGAAEAGVVIEVVHLGGAVVVFLAEGDGGVVQGDGDAVGTGAAEGGQPWVWGPNLGLAWCEADVTRARGGRHRISAWGGLTGLGGLKGSGVEAHKGKS